MTITVVYESTRARVKITASTVGITGVGTATTAIIEHSLDQFNWNLVRCGTDVPIVSGVATVYDYEFKSDVVNYYRTTFYRDFTFVGVGTAAHGDNASVVPTLPGGGAAGDIIFIEAAIDNLNAFPNTPTGYTLLVQDGNLRLYGKVHTGTESNPTVTFSGGSAGSTTSAQAAIMRGLQLLPTHFSTAYAQDAAQNIAYDSLDLDRREVGLVLAWKADDWLSVATLPALSGAVVAEIGEPSSTTGNDQGIVWDYYASQSLTTITVPTGSFIVSGGTSAMSDSIIAAFAPLTSSQTTSLTPVLTDVWLKSVGKPFLNRTFTCVPNISPIERDPRHAIFEVLNRSYPIAVTDFHQSREVTIDVITTTQTEHIELDLIISTGDVMLVHTPSTYPLPSMYVVINRTSELRPLRQPQCNNADYRVFTLPLREVAAPSAAICAAELTWQSVVNTYPTWQDVLNANPSWFALLQGSGSAEDIIVP